MVYAVCVWEMLHMPALPSRWNFWAPSEGKTETAGAAVSF